LDIYRFWNLFELIQIEGRLKMMLALLTGDTAFVARFGWWLWWR